MLVTNLESNSQTNYNCLFVIETILDTKSMNRDLN